MESPETVFQSNFKIGAYPFFEELRKLSPIYPMPGQGNQTTWLVTQYEDVKELLKSRSFIKDQKKLFPDFSQALERSSAIFQNMMLDADPPNHTRLRKLVQPYFNPKKIKELEPRIHEISEHLLIEMKQKEGPVDLVDDFAFPLPIIVICELLGVPSEDRNTFRKWSNTIVAAADEFEEDFVEDVEAFLNYLKELFEERRKAPGDDLISNLLRAEEEGKQLSTNELYSMVVLLIIAGHETTVNLIANTMQALFENPDQLGKLKADLSLTSTAIEEGLRYYSPVDFSTARWSEENLEFHGQTIRRGDMVLASLSSANRDAQKFTDADRLDITRTSNPHVAFGYGIHFCLGAPLARLEGKVGIENLLRTFPDIQPDPNSPSPEWKQVFLLRGLNHLYVHLKT